MVDKVGIEITADNESAPELKAAEEGITKIGDAAVKAAPKIKGVGDSFDSVGDAAKRSSKSTDDHASRLDAVGERADETEGKFTGLASGIDGVTSLMDDPSPQEFAQGLADISDGAANFLVPALKSAGNAVSNVAQRLTGATTGMQALGRGAALAAGAAGIGLLLVSLNKMGQAAHDAKIKELADDFIATGESMAIAAVAADENLFTLGDLYSTFKNLLETSPLLAEQFVSLAEAAGLNSELTSSMRDELAQAADVQKGLEKATKDTRTEIEKEEDAVAAFNAELDKMLGKAYAATEAQANLTIAVHDAAETVKANREEIGAAATSLDIHTEAGARNVLMIEDLVRKEAEVIEAMKLQGATNSELSAEIDRGTQSIEDQAAKMGFDRDQVHMLTGALQALPRKVTADIGIRGVPQSIHDIGRIQQAINDLRGRDVGIRIVGTAVGVRIPGGGLNAHGGITGAASGGARGGLTWVGEEGPELVQVPFGSKVHSNPDSMRMASGWGDGGVTVNVNVYGSLVAERDLIGRLRNELVRGGLNLVGLQR